ncbi:hypothetical protein MFU01_70490 [Myxococcus fulvus]|uniref:Uncharacterized protein n=1 Tax=Myxococcus fulvus TaxID=33 RepID=A0A511TF35_MYXFU|nr:hypothetical protein MFU01_70490 [Myxococcus fulvus]
MKMARHRSRSRPARWRGSVVFSGVDLQRRGGLILGTLLWVCRPHFSTKVWDGSVDSVCLHRDGINGTDTA